VGFAENIRVAVPVIDAPEYIEAAEKVTRERNAGFMTVMLEGRYTDEYLAEAGGDSPKFTDDELKIISSPLDFVGINVYKPGWYVEPSDEAPGYRDISVNASHPKMQSAWHVLDPEVMYWAPRQMQSIWGAKSIFITENGCGASDVIADDGRVYDSDRLMFLRACLGQFQRATAEGVPVDGYFLWSAQDNFEWMDGYGNRFRPHLRRLRHARANAETQRKLVPRGGKAERGRLASRDSVGGWLFLAPPWTLGKGAVTLLEGRPAGRRVAVALAK